MFTIGTIGFCCWIFFPKLLDPNVGDGLFCVCGFNNWLLQSFISWFPKNELGLLFELLNILPGPGLARLLLEILEIGLLELF